MSDVSPINDDLNVVNLSSYQLSEIEYSVLSKGLSFCPSQNLNKFEVIKDVQLFARNLILKQIYSKTPPLLPTFESLELQALDALVGLLEENETPDLIDQIDLNKLLGRYNQLEPPPIPTFKKKIRQISNTGH